MTVSSTPPSSNRAPPPTLDALEMMIDDETSANVTKTRVSLAPRHHLRTHHRSLMPLPPPLSSAATALTTSQFQNGSKSCGHSAATASSSSGATRSIDMSGFPDLPTLEPRRVMPKATVSQASSISASSISDRKQSSNSLGAGCLLHFVSHMSLRDDQMAPNGLPEYSRNRQQQQQDDQEEAKDAFDVSQRAMEICDSSTSVVDSSLSRSNKNKRRVRASSVVGFTSLPIEADWSLTTPETTKTLLTTPQAVHMTCQKRKSPMIHETPVAGNRPLILPSLNTVCNAPVFPNYRLSHDEGCGDVSSSNNQEHRSRGLNLRKRAKSQYYRTLLNNAPMLPTSPDLEDKFNIAHRIQTPCYSPVLMEPTEPLMAFVPRYDDFSLPEEGATTTAPAGRLASTSSLDSQQQQCQRSAPTKWLRMKRRNSLLCALRLAASNEGV